jgi:Dyp-type peroxidase family
MTPDPGSWRLAPEYAAATQGLIVSPFGHLSQAIALLLDTSAAPGSAWLRLLRDPSAGCLTITDATGKSVEDDGSNAGCAAIAFTAPGLTLLGLDPAVSATFPAAFTEGMHAPNRRRRLADALLDPPTRQRRPFWGANIPCEADPDAVTCDKTVHAAVLLYHETDEKLAAYAAPVRDCLTKSGVIIAHEMVLSLMPDPDNPSVTREHFGFADGISQPNPFGAAIVTKEGALYPRDPVHGVASGDLLIGHINAHEEPAPGPTVPGDSPGAAGLPPDPVDPTQRSLGLNGTYLVMRELSQSVEEFWASMEKAAQQIGAPDAKWIAERVMGRTKDGVILSADPPPATKDGPGNDFMFWETDAQGLQCPLGSHVRRANPRDGLAPSAGDRPTLLKAANNHRILRRGRKYGPYTVPDRPSRPGLLFMCLNTDIERQFEFVQQTWMLNPSFAALFDERDPLLGPAGPFTIPADPLRLRPAIDTFIRLIGGEYFFLPSLPALDYLAGLTSPTAP